MVVVFFLFFFPVLSGMGVGGGGGVLSLTRMLIGWLV